jgi:aspartate aminotransferase
VDKLKELGSIHDWSHIEKQCGMFAYSGLKNEMVEEIRNKHSVYFPLDGRITIPAINKNNIDYFC